MILAAIFFIVLGLLNLFAKNLMWSLTEWGNELRGVQSERTDWWDTRMSIQGIVALLLGALALYATFAS